MFKKEDLKEFIIFVFITIAIFAPIRLFVAKPFIVSGASMYPTFETGQYLIVDKISYKLKKPERGDVVIFRYPADPSKFFIKRIIGLPGEKIEIDGKNVSIKTMDDNVVVLDEPYIEMFRDSFLSTELKDTEYFVMGDNRSASLDSRFWGPLGEEFIIGKAFIRLTPLNKINILPGDFNF
ncbi:MAG TPA: signal peptidase I [Candidatus Paceibacterota bacterium]|nr:signal peptidase I [Candidatus Paceibacterota bacterium]